MRESNFTLDPEPPFRLDLTAWALRRRPINKIDDWDGETYSRVFAIHNQPAFVQVRQSGSPASARLHVKVLTQHPSSEMKRPISSALEKMFGLHVNLDSFYRFAKADPQLGTLSRRFCGLKPPRFPSVFEGIVNGIACQQLTLHVGLTLLSRLSERSGLPFKTSAGVRFSFPDSEQLNALPIRSFRAIGFSTNKAIAMKTISKEIQEGVFEPDSLATWNDTQAIERLLKLRGIGRWTAEYVLLRGLGRTSIFPGDDIGARNNLKRWLKLRGVLDYESVSTTLSRWRPFAGLIYFHLLLDGLDNSGYLALGQPDVHAA